MHRHHSLFAIGVVLWSSFASVQANTHQYLNISTPDTTPSSTLGLTAIPTNDVDSEATSFPVTSVALNSTYLNTTSIESAAPSTTELLLPTTVNNQDTSSVYLNATATGIYHSYNASTTAHNHAFNTSVPKKQYTNATATASRWFTYANTTRQSTGPTPPPVRLTPALPPSIDPRDPVILQPNRTVNLYFQDPAPIRNGSEIPMASVDIPKMAYPAVVLDHSALIEDIECDLTKLRLKFLHRDALNVAEGSWTMPKFVMMAFAEKCGKAARTGERDYLLVNGLKFNHKKLSVSADIKHISVVEAVGKDNPVTVDMGSYTPGSLNGTTGFDSQAASTTARNGTQTNTTAPADFDVSLDDTIGYTTLQTAQNIKRFTGLDLEKHLVARGWFSKIVKSVTKVVKKVVKTVEKVVEKFIPSWTLTPLNKNIDINLGGGNTNTPFGKSGYQLYSKTSGSNYIRLYCVDCGVRGVVNVKATVTFNLVGLITSGSFSATGWLDAGLGLGVDASYSTSIPAFDKTIVAIPLSPFSIPGLITIGPHLDFGVGANAGLDARGNIYAGIRLKWPAIHAQLNLYSAPSASGWIPQVVPEFQAAGYVTMTASVYGKVSLGFGVSILNGMKSFGVALVEKPELYVGGTTTDKQCSGLKVSAGFRNTVYADVFGSHHNINVWDGPRTGKCVRIRKRDGLPTLDPPPRTVRTAVNRANSVQIKTPAGELGLHYADNGNVYALPQGNGSVVDMSTVSFSTTSDGIITGDVESRIFHGYTDTLGSIGVSRFRLSRPDHIPKTALVVTLQKSKDEEFSDVLVALDGSHNVYYPVVCTFNGKDFPRVFLTKNPEEGAGILSDEDNVDDITGVKPDECSFIPFVGV